jgi:hypothetical protein
VERREFRLEENQRRAAATVALATQKTLKAAETKRMVRRTHRPTTDLAVRLAEFAEEPTGESRFLKMFAAVEQKRSAVSYEGYRLFMSRFELVSTTCACGEVLVVGEIDASVRFVACTEEARCEDCFGARHTDTCRYRMVRPISTVIYT